MTADPSIASVDYSPGALALTWVPDGASAFVIALNDITTGAQTTYPATGFGITLKVTLAAADSYTVQIGSKDGGTQGPFSTAISILTATPTLTRIANLVSSADLTWSAPTGYSGSYVAVLQQIGGWSRSSDPVDVLTYSFSPLDEPLEGTQTIAGVQVQQTLSGGVTTTGPLVYLTVITATATMSAVDYSDGQTLQLSWTSSSSPPTYTAFLVQGQQSSAKTVSASSCGFTGLTATGSYSTYVCVSSPDGVSLGPPTASYAVLTTAPAMTGLLTSAAGLQLTWQGLGGADGYLCYAQPAGGTVQSATASGSSYRFTSLVPVVSGTTAWMQGTASNGIVLSPRTQSYTALAGQTLWQLVSYDTAQLSLTWTAPPDITGITGYLITIEGATPSQFPTGSTATTAQLALALSAGTDYPTTVVATNGIVQGIPSPQLVPLTTPPSDAWLSYNGTALQLSWTAPSQGDVTGSIAKLLANGGQPETIPQAASPQNFTTGFASATAFTAQVRATGPATQGPWSPVATGPYQTALTYGYDTQARLTSEAWQGASTIAYTIGAAGDITSVTPQAGQGDNA